MVAKKACGCNTRGQYGLNDWFCCPYDLFLFPQLTLHFFLLFIWQMFYLDLNVVFILFISLLNCFYRCIWYMWVCFARIHLSWSIKCGHDWLDCSCHLKLSQEKGEERNWVCCIDGGGGLWWWWSVLLWYSDLTWWTRCRTYTHTHTDMIGLKYKHTEIRRRSSYFSVE